MKIKNREQGMIMVIVLMILMGVSLLGLASLLVVGTDLRITGHYKASAQAFWAAESGLQEAIGTLRTNRSFSGDLNTQSLNNGSNYSVTVDVMSDTLKRVVATGRQGGTVRTIEAIVTSDTAFGAVINLGGDLRLEGKPRVSSEGIRLNGNAYLNLDSGTPDLNIYLPTGSQLNVDGDTGAVHRSDKPAMDLGAIKLSDTSWRQIASSATTAWSFDTDKVYGDRDTNMTFNNLNFDDIPVGPDGNRAIFVDGDVTINGEISGIGTVIATGKVICTGGFVAKGPTVTFIAKDDVLINFDTNAQSTINGLVYTEGDYELHGKVKFFGVVTAFGSVTVQNPSQFTNNSDPNFWYTYSPAYSIIADSVNVLSWSEVTR